MGPRKLPAFSAGKDDGAAAGKMRKVGSTPRGSSSPRQSVGAATTDLPYTNEERSFLRSQLALFTARSATNADDGVSACGTKFSKMTKEQWLAGLPLLVSATEKVLQMAAEQYQQKCGDRAAAAAAMVGDGGTSESGDGISNRSGATSSNGSGTTTDGQPPSGAAGASPTARTTPAAGTPAQFVEENAYMIAQAQQLLWYPFTYQRWIELLLEPGKYHTARDDGRLRGDAIQASLRRCILVTCPAVEGDDIL